MKVIKPQRLGLLTHSFENDGRAYFVITAMAYYAFGAEERPMHEAAMWSLVPEKIGPQTVFDAGMTKTRSDVLVAGKAISIGAKPVPARSVRLRVSRGEKALVDKELYVVGDRRWELGAMSAPQPFTEMPVVWERAFGGQNFPDNPLGRGHEPVEVDGVETHFLPNVEDPKRLVKKKSDRPAPVGFGPVDQTWPERMRKAGTYDDLWLKTRFPGLAADIDWTFFNAAPKDQQIEGYFSGDESIEVHGMHAEKSVVKTRAPKLRARLFIIQKKPSGEVMREAQSRIDTIWLFPNEERGVALFRGMLEVEEDDAADVLHVIAAFERPGEARSLDHYRAVLEKRQDKKHGALHALIDDDLMPSKLPGEAAEEPPEDVANEMEAVLERDGLLRKRLDEQVDKEIAKMREEVVAAGLDPKEFDAKVAARKKNEPPKEISKLPAFIEAAQAEVEEAKKKQAEILAMMEAEAREGAKQLGVDYDEAVKRSKDGKGGPPKFSAEKELEWLRDQIELGKNAGMPAKAAEEKLANPEYIAKLRETEQRLLEAYRRFTHFSPPAPLREEEASRVLRQGVIASLEKKESLAERDLTGVDLSGLDLSGVDLRNALLERANLTGAKLTGADLSGATLARAKLDEANLDRATIVRTNFGLASLKKARFGGGIEAKDAIFWQADLEEAHFAQGKLDGVQFIEANLEKADFSGVSANKTLFLKAKLSSARLSSAVLCEAIFLESVVAGANFAKANLKDATFVKVAGEKASFAGASLEGARMVLETSFAGGDFRGATFLRTCLRTTNFAGADFTAATMPEVDFSECDMRGAKLRMVKADGGLFIRTDLSGADLVSASLKMAIMQKTKLHGADLRGANLFRSDMAKVKLDPKTQLADAYLVEVRVVPEKKRAEGAS